jgi:CBS domain-containing protein
MLAKEIMRRPPITIPITATVEEAAEAMAKNNVGLLVIIDPKEPKKPLGVISERDVVRAIANKLPLTTTVDRAGTMARFIWIAEDEPITRAADLMRRHRVRHLVVLDKNGELAGVISVRDLIAEERIIESLSAERRPATKE